MQVADGRVRWVAAGAIASGAVVAALALAGVLGGDDGASGTREVFAPPPPVRIRMSAPPDGSGRGVATIGLTPAARPYMDLTLERLAPPRRGSVYVLWIDGGTGRGYPLPAAIEPSATGTFRRRYNLSEALAPILSLGRSLDLLAVGAEDIAPLARQVEAAGRRGDGARLPARPGAVVLRGPIPQR